MAALWRNIKIHIKASEFKKKLDCETPRLKIKRNGEGPWDSRSVGKERDMGEGIR